MKHKSKYQRGKFRTAMVGAVLSTIVIFTGAVKPVSAADTPGEGVSLTPCTSTALEGWFREMVVKRGLEALGYKVEMPTTLSVPAFHQAVTTGDCSYAFDHWDQLHAVYYESIESQAVLLGPGVRGASQGILASKAVADAHGLTSLDQLSDPALAALFDSDDNGKGNLCCTAPGWGAERVVNHLVGQLGLEDTIDHVQGEYSVLIADVVERHKRGEPVLFYTWTPNWLLGILRPGKDMIWLTVAAEDCEDPLACGSSSSGFPVNDIYMLTNRAMADENPSIAGFMNAVNIPMSALNAQNMQMHGGEDSEKDVIRHADQWIVENKALFDKWVQSGLDASS